MTETRSPNSKGIQAADTVLSVLEAVAYAEEPIGVTQAAAAAGVVKSAAFRHLRTLVDRGYLVQDHSTSRFRLGPKVFLLGRLAPAGHDLAGLLQPAMREARDASGLSAVISTPTPQGAFVLGTISGTQPIDIGVRVGSSLSLHGSAQGKVFLAFGPGRLLDRALGAPRPAGTPHTITDAAALEAEIRRVRERGYATAPEETLLGVNSIAAPVRDAQGEVVAAVALVGSIQHIEREPDLRLVRIVLDFAQKSSRLVAGPSGRRT